MKNFLSTLVLISLFEFIKTCEKPSVDSTVPKTKPNIILFLVDDMGWMDCGAYGSQYYETPNIDTLAKKGMLFTNAYSASPLCSPTRASLLTGKYPARHGITSATGHLPPQPQGYDFMPEKAAPGKKLIMPESKNYLDPDEYTISEALRDAGYRTAHLGKWHLGLTQDYWPDKHGFDVIFHCAPDPGPPDYFSPYGVHSDGKPSGPHKVGNITDGPPGEHIMDRLAAEAENFIEENRDGPFLLHLWSYGVHGPWQAKEEYTREFANKTDPRNTQSNPVMASMLKSVDDCLGRIVDKLEKEGISGNTIIIFTSDNGGNAHSMINPFPDNEYKARNLEWITSYREWAGFLPPTNNYPLLKGKSWTFEGGVRVPLIVVWPGIVKPASQSDAMVSAIDYYPTVLDIVGLKKNLRQVIDGQSYLPVLKGEANLDRDVLFNYFPHGDPSKPATVTVRKGDWKLIRFFETSNLFPEEYLLFDLQEDIGETNNLAQSFPDIVKSLDRLIDDHLRETKANVPVPNPAYNK